MLLCEGDRQDPTRDEGPSGGGRKPGQLRGFRKAAMATAFFRAQSARSTSDSEGHECQDQGLWLPFRWWGVVETSHLWVPAWEAACNLQGVQELLGPQAALPIPAYHCKTVKEASTGLAGVKLPTLQFQPDQLCYETRAGHGGRKPEGPHVFSSKVG